MQAIRTGSSGQCGIAIDQRPRSVLMAEVNGGMDERGAARHVEPRFPQLHQLQAAFQRMSESQQLRVHADLASMSDRVKLGQGQRGKHWSVGRQHG